MLNRNLEVLCLLLALTTTSSFAIAGITSATLQYGEVPVAKAKPVLVVKPGWPKTFWTCQGYVNFPDDGSGLVDPETCIQIGSRNGYNQLQLAHLKEISDRHNGRFGLYFPSQVQEYLDDLIDQATLGSGDRGKFIQTNQKIIQHFLNLLAKVHT